jgi:uncharacterized protein YybS (DUF2232 family)
MTATRTLPLAVLGGLLAALLFIAAEAGGIGGGILRWMAPLPLFAAGLALGVPAMGVACITGLGAVVAGDPEMSIVFAIVTTVPVLVLAPLALRPSVATSPGRLVVGLTALGVAAFGLADLMFLGQPGGLQGVIAPIVEEVFRQLAEQVPTLTTEQLGAPEKVALWLPGVTAVTWMLGAAMNGLLAYGALARFHWNRQPVSEMASIAIPRVVSLGFGAALIAAQVGTGEVAFLGVNLAEILVLPLMFGGLGVIHALIARYPAPQMWLTMFYMVVLGLGLPVVLIVVLGVMEQWAGLRQRFAAAPRQGEE